MRCALVVACCFATSASIAAPSVLVKTASAEHRRFSETITAYGVLEADPEHVLAVSIPRAGLVSQVWVELGQRVAVGERLLAISTAPDAYLQYQQARSALDFARREAAREAQLLAQQLSTRSRSEAAHKALLDAQAALTALEANGMGAPAQTLSAPVDGVVIRVDVQQGQRVAADSTTVLLADQRQLIARLGVEPEDRGRLVAGAAVTVTGIFDPAVTFTSAVRMVHGGIDPLTRLVDVLVPVPTGLSIEPLLGTDLISHIKLTDSDSLAVPRSAVLRDEQGSHVFTVTDGQARRVAVDTGATDDEWVAVSGALTAAAVVIIQGNYGLTDGMAVRVATP